MRIGFSSIYSWRPFVEQQHYLATLTRDAGHETRFLTCDADLPSCYGRELRPARPAWLHCAMCRAGGARSYESGHISRLGHLASCSSAPLPDMPWSASSAGTLGRFETHEEFASLEYKQILERLEPAARMAYDAARRWIEREKLDAVCLYNGRIDVTRGVLEAAKDCGVPYISYERTLFGDGLQLLPGENCLGLRTVDRMVREWKDVPLTRHQALRAAGHIAARFLRRNSKEWRAYNTSAKITDWPARGRRKVLLTPSSRNEMWGHPDWQPDWRDPLDGFDAVIDRLGLQGEDVVLRCHPNWGEVMGTRDGAMSENHFTQWARSRGITVIGSSNSTSTMGLLAHADAVVVNGGSAALEAGMLGKQVIAVSPSFYQQAGLQNTVYGPGDVASLRLNADETDPAVQAADSARIARQTLRFCYTMVYRLPQFVSHVRSVTTTQFEYLQGADPDRLTRLYRSGVLEPDDASRASADAGEQEVLQLAAGHEWEVLYDAIPPSVHGGLAKRPVHRRWMFRPIDRLREAMPRGDR